MGDFHKYSDDISEETPKKTRFYHIQTAPTEDILSEKYAEQLNIGSLYINKNKKNLYTALYEKHNLFGSVLYDSENTRPKDKIKAGAQDQLSAPQYFDPESIYRSENITAASDLPVTEIGSARPGVMTLSVLVGSTSTNLTTAFWSTGV